MFIFIIEIFIRSYKNCYFFNTFMQTGKPLVV